MISKPKRNWPGIHTPHWFWKSPVNGHFTQVIPAELIQSWPAKERDLHLMGMTLLRRDFETLEYVFEGK